MPSHPIDQALSRSWLLVNANRPADFDRAARSDADQVILDIEDAVDPAHKRTARAEVAEWLDRPDQCAWVRINDVTSEFWEDDIELLRGRPGLIGIVLAKTETVQHIADTVSHLGNALPIIALVESALGIEEAPAIARQPGTFRLAFGSGDYRRDTATAATDLAMAYPRTRLTIASRIGNLPGPIDGPTTSADPGTVREHTTLAQSLGMTGRLCLTAPQTGLVNEAMGPSITDISWAQSFLKEFDDAGRILRDGSDKPRLYQAKRITRLAAAYRLTPDPAG